MSEGDIVGLLMEAISFATIKHKNQRRKDSDKTPYINHPVGVAYSIWKEGGVTDVAVLQVYVCARRTFNTHKKLSSQFSLFSYSETPEAIYSASLVFLNLEKYWQGTVLYCIGDYSFYAFSLSTSCFQISKDALYT